MFTVGITGSIGTGKSEVGKYLRLKGYSVIDADEVAGILLSKGSDVLRQISICFGNDAICEDGTYNRKYTADLVFKNPEKLKQLNSIVHPALRDRISDMISDMSAEGKKIVFFECPLLFEAEFDDLVDTVWCIVADKKLQISRIVERDFIDSQKAEYRIESQMSGSQKAQRSDTVICNDGTPAELHGRIDAELGKLKIGQTDNSVD